MQRFFDINLFFLLINFLSYLKSIYNTDMAILLIGYMGSGKSTIAKELAKLLNFNCIDLDEYIEMKENQSISELFRSKGEIYFRKIESQCLKEVVQLEHVVISLGGGTPCYGNNMEMIKSSPNSKSVYLKASLACLTDRLYEEKSKRPLISHINTKREITEFIGKHLFERSYFYNQADCVITVDNKSALQISEEIQVNLF